MKYFIPLFLFVFLYVSVQTIVPQIAGAEQALTPHPSHGVAMHGQPKYGKAATHLDYTNANAPKGGVLKQSVIGGFDTLNPYNIKGKAATGLHYTQDRLAARVWDEPFTLYGLIAQDIIVPKDRSGIAFKLNPKARFHDGSPITSADVAFSFETLKQNGRPNMRRVYGLVKDTIIHSPRHISFAFGDGFDQETALIIAMMPILSKKYWQDKDFSATTLDAPLGSGPYKITKIDAGRSISYERVKDYWAADHFVNKGQHNFDVLEYDYYRDKNVAIQAFKSEEIDVFRVFDAASWQNNFLSETGETSYKKESIPHQRPEWVRAFIFNTKKPLFEDLRVRKALNLAFDFNWMNKTLFHGETKRITSTFPNTALAAPSSPTLLTDQLSARERLRAADALLKDAGWGVQDGKRIHETSGEEFTFSVLLNQPEFEKVLLHWAQSLKRLGISFEIRSIDSAQFTGRLNDYDYDMVLYRWINSLSPGTEQQIYWGCEAAETKGSRNYAQICDPTIDSLAKQVAQAQNREQLTQTIHELDAAIMNAHLMIPLYYIGKDYVAYTPQIQRPDVTPLYGMVLESWWRTPSAENQN